MTATNENVSRWTPKGYRLSSDADREKLKAYLDESIRWWRVRHYHPAAADVIGVLQQMRRAFIGSVLRREKGGQH